MREPMVLNAGYDSTNYYLAPLEDHQYLLIDCGWPGTLPKLKNRFKQYGIEPDAVKYLIITHFHPDHSGIAEDLRRIGCTVVLEETQLLFVGQSKQQYKADSISFVMYPSVFTGDLHRPSQVPEDLIGVVKDSWRRIHQTGLTKIFPGHGPSIILE